MMSNGVAFLFSFFISIGIAAAQQATSELTNKEKALLLFKRLNGVSISIDDPIITQIEARLAANDPQGAARAASSNPTFLSAIVKDFAAKMATREETVDLPLNDFTATVVGIVRDSLNAKEMLTGNFYYRGTPALANVPENIVSDILVSNNHYAALQANYPNWPSNLQRVEGQVIRNAAAAAVAHPEPAGVITSRTFMEAHATAGTNRRLVEYTFKAFLCVPMTEFADASGSDAMVGRDVDRFPAGSNEKYQVSCKACHSNHDPLRPAFAKFDFANGFVKHASILANGTGENQMRQNPVGISAKMNINADVFPQGYQVTNTVWLNQANRGSNVELFGWRDASSGSGLRQFATMIANSQAFSKCMTKRAFKSVCKRDPTVEEAAMVRTLATGFETSGYRLRELFEAVALRPECLGE